MSDGNGKEGDRIDWELVIGELRDRIAELLNSDDAYEQYRAKESKKILGLLLASYRARWDDDYPIQEETSE
ncbi:hypothetical protein C5Y96_15175 [Blastopirellula marina]|uniref:Uncharacterized protein n=1 Tax=Blastopirellula marina TaxID=124 RepID=A0A2S8FA97_9BACT|nr:MULTISPECIES: hypothetical protein [Pirellulaceae]PQO29096.1 hypothetical protein C5Y96_15175 [Blastopirellula marina]RCS50287.1 hypothetical protein DTL36_15185 [Bremerella cremea]